MFFSKYWLHSLKNISSVNKKSKFACNTLWKLKKKKKTILFYQILFKIYWEKPLGQPYCLNRYSKKEMINPFWFNWSQDQRDGKNADNYESMSEVQNFLVNNIWCRWLVKITSWLSNWKIFYLGRGSQLSRFSRWTILLSKIDFHIIFQIFLLPLSVNIGGCRMTINKQFCSCVHAHSLQRRSSSGNRFPKVVKLLSQNA